MIDRHTLRVIDPAVLEQLRRPSLMEEAMRKAVNAEAERQHRDARISKAILDMAAEERARSVRTRRMIESYSNMPGAA